jgi:eukaryotic-like serine/threonine-protein kinase
MEDGVRLSLKVLDPTSSRPLREKEIHVATDQQTTLPDKAVRAAAELLDINHYKPDPKRTKVGTANPEAYSAFQAAEVLRKQDNDTGLDAAIAKYKQAIDIDPHYAAAQAGLAWAYIRSYFLHGDSAALGLARENSESAAVLDPNLIDAHLGLAWVDQQQGNSEKAGQEMVKALALDPTNPRTLVKQGDFYVRSERWKEAEDTYNRVLKLRPNYWVAHNELGFLLYAQGRYADALMEFRKASLISPNSALAYANIGTVYLPMGKLADAVTNLQKSYQLNANDEAAIGLAAINRIQGKYSEAISHAQDAVKLEPSMASDWLELGDCYSAAGGQRKEAAAAYKRAREVQEEQMRVEARNGPGWMLLALCNAKADRLDSTAALMEKAEALGANDMDSQLMKVRILVLLNRGQESFAAMSRCIARGATAFQFQTMPDLEPLRNDPRFKKMVESSGSAPDSRLE